MFFYLVYFFLSPFFFLLIHIIKFFNSKIYNHIKYEKESFYNVLNSISKINRNEKKILIFHAASAGEFEQLKPILTKISRNKYFIIQSFTSPTIYNKESLNKLFDICCYHPYDLWWSSYMFFSKINPDAYIITRQDIWPIHLFIANKLNIKIFYINANLHKKSIWIKPFIKQFSKAIFKNLSLCLVPTKNVYNQFIKIINKDKLIITGDSRFDQVIDRSKINKAIDYLPKVFSKSSNIIFGSYDIYDEKYILYGLDKMYENNNDSLVEYNHRILLVPHEVNDETIERMKKSLKEIGFTYQLLSALNKNHEDFRVLIIDKVGILADLYRICNLAYVGSGFSDGVHSVIEPGIHGCAVGFGPNIELLEEAKSIYNKKIGIKINNKDDMFNFLSLINKKEAIAKLGDGIKNFILENRNASNKILKIIEKKI